MIAGGIKIKVFCPKDEDAINQQDLGVPIKLVDCILKEYTIYNVDFITSHDVKYSIVSCGGEDFIVNETADSLNKKIAERQSFRFN